jgi:putative ABC transport system permease protein
MMIINYLKIALRNIRRHKSFAILNITGLAVALAACLVIFLVLQYEFSYDTYHKKASRIHQLVKKRVTTDGEAFRTSIPFAATPALRSGYPHITFTDVFTRGEAQVTIADEKGEAGNKKFLEQTGIFYAEPELFRLFDVKWLSGSPALLNNENEMVLNRSLAEKYFGSWQTAIGKMIRLDNKFNLRVSGVIEDVPANSDFPFSLMISFKTFLANVKEFGYNDLDSWNWAVSWHQIYALLPQNTNLDAFNAQVEKYTSGFFEQGPNQKLTYYFRPLSEVHFDTRFENNGNYVISKTSLYTLFFIGVLILTMACINFVNLSTALAAKRSKEVGVRKVLGGNRGQVRWQVLAETGVIVLTASAIALVLARIALPYLKYVVVTQEPLSLFNWSTIGFVAGIAAITILLSGIYPAFVLSRFKPVEAIKNRIDSRQVGGISLRRILVVLQFAFSQLLIIATIIAVSQMSFIRNSDLGINKESVLILNGNTDSSTLAKQPAFKNELLKIPGVRSVSYAYSAPVSDEIWVADFYFNGVEKEIDFGGYLKFGDEDYLKTFGMQLVAGRFYEDKPFVEIVVNETLVKKLGFKTAQEVIGKTLRINNDGPWLPVVGVVRDFKNITLRDEIPPTILLKQVRRQRLTAIKMDGSNISQTEQAVQATWEKFYPEYVYNRRFLDETIDNFYREERQMSSTYKIYAILAMIISCLGLYGLVSFMAVQRTKEVGIRKVLGASTGNIVYLFSKEFTLLVIIAFAIAAPVAWYMMSNWLENFVFRIDIGAGVFVLAIFSSMLIAWLTVGYKALKAAMANPVKSLRTE